MTTKLKFLWVLLAMLVGGVGDVWAEATTINLTTGDAVCSMVSDGSFAFTPSIGTGNNAPSYNTSEGKSGLRFYSGNTLTISSSFLTITNVSVQFTKDGSDDNIRSSNINNLRIDTNDDTSWAKTFSNKSYSGNSNGLFNITLTPARNSLIFSFNKIDASGSDPDVYISSITITYTDNRTALTTFAFNSDEVYIHDGTGSGGTYVNGTTFVYDASKTTLRTKLNIDPALSTIGASANSTYFTVTSSNSSVLNVGGALSYSEALSGTRVYIDGIRITGLGDATLTFTFAGTSTYKSTSTSVTIHVIDHSITPYSGTYRYTWDFSGGDWASTIAQLGYGNGSGGNNWTKTVDAEHAEARPTYHNWIPSYSGIDMIAGLEFNLTDKADLCLDWFEGRKAIWMNTDATVIIPNLVAGQTITITADNNNYTIDAGSATKSENVITVTSAGSVTLKMAQATRISSIAVSNSSYGWEYTTTETTLDIARKTSGTFTFTEAGPITGGTVIDEVPGITLTVGASGDSWEVVDATALDGSYNLGAAAAYCGTKINNQQNPTSGCFYSFTPIVNGELTVHYYTTATAYIYESGTQVGYNGTNRQQDLTINVEAGKTYKLVSSLSVTWGGCLHLNSYTFTPKFFSNGTTTPQLTIGDFDANMNTDKSAFPKLINPSSTEQQNKVKFAGDKAKVYLYKNNDVELLAAGEDILIRGTVLDKNNEDGLVAYYYLNSYVLTVTSYELADQAYIATDGLVDGMYQIEFSGAIQAAAEGGSSVTVQVQKDAETVENVTATITGTTLYVPFNASPFASLEAGATYRITIPANSIALTANTDTKNSKIERTFSVNAIGEAQVKMIYPTGLATVGTSVILETYINGTKSNVSNSHKVKGILTGGGTTMPIDATFSSEHVVFKPTSTLLPNTTYSLTVPIEYDNKDNKIYLTTKYTETPEVYYQITHNKVFRFTTGSSSGTAPFVIENGTSPAEGATIPSYEYSSGTISFTFNQAVELEPYTTVDATPINGSEATVSGSTGAPGATDNTLTVSADGKTVSFNYTADKLKYDLYYQVVIPANTVVGAGGLPNPEPITLNFKMDKNPSSLVSSKVFQGYGAGPIYHPYTWNFTNIGTAGSTTLTDLATATEGENYKTLRWRKNESSYGNYVTNQQDKTPKFPQGDVLSYYIDSQNKEIKEASGLRWSLTKDFGSGLNRVQIPESGTSLHIVGNTHYLTIPDVPAGAKLYIKANHSDLLNVNSPNATFIQGAASDDETNTIGAKTTSSRVYILNCTGGDVSFCLDDVYFEKIAVVTEEKTITEVGYATNAREYAVDYTLNQDFLNKELKAYKVTGVSGSNAVATQVQYVPAYGGVMLKATGDSYPMFAWDCNRVTSDMTENRLVGVVDGESTDPLPQKSGSLYNYILSTGGVNVKYNYEGEVGDEENQQGTFGGYVSGLAFYLVMKEGTILENGTAYAYEKPKSNSAYLQLDSYLARQTGTGTESGARQYFLIDFGDETTSVIGIEDTSKPSMSDDSLFSLQGVLVEKPSKGLYIRKGKKIVIK